MAAAVVVAVAAETHGKMCFRRSKLARNCCKRNLAAHQWAMGQLEVAGSVAVVAVAVAVAEAVAVVVAEEAAMATGCPTCQASFLSTTQRNQPLHGCKRWLEVYAPGVLQCEGYEKDLRAECVPSPTNSVDVLMAHGIFGVKDSQTCRTTYNLLSVIEGVCATLGLDIPHI